jgi:hypothetical protein
VQPEYSVLLAVGCGVRFPVSSSIEVFRDIFAFSAAFSCDQRIERGYEAFAERLSRLGASIQQR